jgi:salicylate hydroxylase
LGVNIIVNSRVTTYNPDAPSITVEDGQIHQADLIVAADGEFKRGDPARLQGCLLILPGIKSTARNYVSKGFNSEPKPTKYAVYRATVDVVKMRDIPEVAWLLEKPGLNIW